MCEHEGPYLYLWLSSPFYSVGCCVWVLLKSKQQVEGRLRDSEVPKSVVWLFDVTENPCFHCEYAKRWEMSLVWRGHEYARVQDLAQIERKVDSGCR